MTTHPADTAKPGDAFHDEAGHTWVMDPDYNTPWFTPIQVDGRSWHTAAEARERTLTPLAPPMPADWCTLTHFDTPDASNPAHAKFVVAWLASAEPFEIGMNLGDAIQAVDAYAGRLDTDNADQALAEQIALAHGAWKASSPTARYSVTAAVVAGIRAGRDAERGRY